MGVFVFEKREVLLKFSYFSRTPIFRFLVTTPDLTVGPSRGRCHRGRLPNGLKGKCIDRLREGFVGKGDDSTETDYLPRVWLEVGDHGRHDRPR